MDFGILRWSRSQSLTKADCSLFPAIAVCRTLSQYRVLKMLDEMQKASFFLKAWQCCQERKGNYQKQGESSIPGKFQLELVLPSDTCQSLWPSKMQRAELKSESWRGGEVGLEPIRRSWLRLNWRSEGAREVPAAEKAVRSRSPSYGPALACK